MEWNGRVLVLLSTLSFVLIPFLAPVLGDGMAVYEYEYKKDKEEQEKLYGYTYESRQLARIRQIDKDTQRIDLFLSVFSLMPDGNLTLIVPFRQMPEKVTLRETTDSDFLDSISYDKIHDLSKKQDFRGTSVRFKDKASGTLRNGALSCALTPIGYGCVKLAETYEVNYDSDRYGDGDYYSAGETGSNEYGKEKKVKEVSSYEFEGTSVSVFSVSANATLKDFVEATNITPPPSATEEVISEYKGHYAALIRSEPSPPIDASTYSLLWEMMPTTLQLMIERMSANSRMERSEAFYTAERYAAQGLIEYQDRLRDGTVVHSELSKKYDRSPQPYPQYVGRHFNFDHIEYSEIEDIPQTPLDMLRNIISIYMAVYGFTDFSGNILSVTTKIDEGKLYFPLGTSKGWSNPISRTVVVMDVDGSKDLTLSQPGAVSAFVNGRHLYALEYSNANPGEDLEAEVENGQALQAQGAFMTKVLYDITPWFAPIAAVLLYLALFYLFLALFGSVLLWGRPKKQLFGLPSLALGISSLILSAPLTLMGFGVVKEGNVRDDVARRTYYCRVCTLLTAFFITGFIIIAEVFI